MQSVIDCSIPLIELSRTTDALLCSDSFFLPVQIVANTLFIVLLLCVAFSRFLHKSLMPPIFVAQTIIYLLYSTTLTIGQSFTSGTDWI